MQNMARKSFRPTNALSVGLTVAALIFLGGSPALAGQPAPVSPPPHRAPPTARVLAAAQREASRDDSRAAVPTRGI
jgi:hypothetical protein